MAKNHLVLAFFESEAAADKAAADLEHWVAKRNKKGKHRRIDVEAVGVLVKEDDGNVKTHKLGPREGSKGLGIGAVLGLIIAAPIGGIALVEGLAAGGVGGGVVGSFFHRSLGLTDEDVARIAQRLDEGHAALGLLVPPKQAPKVAAKLATFGGEAEAHEVDEDALKPAATNGNLNA